MTKGIKEILDALKEELDEDLRANNLEMIKVSVIDGYLTLWCEHNAKTTRKEAFSKLKEAKKITTVLILGNEMYKSRKWEKMTHNGFMNWDTYHGHRSNGAKAGYIPFLTDEEKLDRLRGYPKKL